MIEWHENMETGVPKIDQQHKKILEKFNEFSAVLETARLDGEKMIEAGKILDFLQFYAVWHFEKEEGCFHTHECPGAQANAKAHERFMAMFNAFYERWQAHGMEMDLVQETFSELTDWFVNHIMRVDTKLKPCVKAQKN